MKILEYITEHADETMDTGILKCEKPFRIRVVLRRSGVKARVLVYLEER